MNESAELALRAVVIGVGATVIMDLWAVLLQRLFRVQPSNWAMVGRWVGHFTKGQFVHNRIADAPPIRGELALGWIVHYLTGITYGALLLGICGFDWAKRPTLLPPLILSLVALVAPFFLLQPGMGLGVAGAKTPNPNATRARSAVNHAVFGLGMYVSGVLSAQAISYEYAITYEDPRCEYSADIKDVSEAVRRDLHQFAAGKVPGVLVACDLIHCARACAAGRGSLSRGCTSQ